MKLFSKISNCIINFLLFVVFICLLFALYNYIQITVLKNKYTSFLGYTYFEIQSGSMEKEIYKNDYVFVKLTKEVNVDDIISYFDGQNVVTHRLIEVNEDTLITKGDNNNANDEPIKRENVIGKVIYVGKDYGKYIAVVTDWKVLFSFFLTVVLFEIALSDNKKEGSFYDKKKIQEEKTD